MMKVTNSTYGEMAANRRAKRMVTLRRIKKDGTPGAPTQYERHSGEKTAQDVINRLQGLNPGKTWVEA